MASTIGIDAREPYPHQPLHPGPYWMSSEEIDLTRAGLSGKVLLFAFPTDGEVYLIHQFLMHLRVAPAGGNNVTSCYVGLGYIQVGASTIGQSATTTYSVLSGCIASAYFMTSADGSAITSATVGSASLVYGRGAAVGGISAQAFSCTASSRGTIIGCVDNPPCIYATIQNGAGTLSAGKVRAHLLVSRFYNFTARS